jgi:dTDP-4-dehydrorhamnose reductase
MNIVLFGADGQLGLELQRSLAPLGNLTALSRRHVDLLEIGRIRGMISALRPAVVVNAAAYTKVDLAESERERAFALNDAAVAEMAAVSGELNAWFIHYSTDYVFDGEKSSPYTERDLPEPLNVYGLSKLRGEEKIAPLNPRHLIFRTSWVYSFLPRNFVYAIMQKARFAEQIDVVSDVIGVPTDAPLIADITALLIFKYLLPKSAQNSDEISGIYNLVPSGQTNWFEYATRIIGLAEKYGIEKKALAQHVRPILSSDLRAAARRPQNSSLDNSKIQDRFDFLLPTWDIRLEFFMKRLSEGMAYGA